MKTIRIILSAGFLISLFVIQYLIWHNEGLAAQQKLISSLFSWIIPCAWLIIILSIEKTTKSDPTVKAKCLFTQFSFTLN